MPKYIEEKELREWIQNWFEKNRYYHPYSKSNNIPIPELYDILEQMPTADVVEVVRCKNCKHYVLWPREGICICDVWTGDPYEAATPGEDDFCSRGERGEDADN